MTDKERTERLLQAADVRRRELMFKGASVLDELGGIAGGTMGGLTGLALGSQLGSYMPAKWRLLATLLGGTGGMAAGGIAGSSLGQTVADNARRTRYREMMEDADINRRKALMDAVAMDALRRGGYGPTLNPYAVQQYG